MHLINNRWFHSQYNASTGMVLVKYTGVPLCSNNIIGEQHKMPDEKY